MNKTVTYLLIGGGIAGAIYLVAKATAQPAQPSALQTVTSGVTSIISSIFGSKAPATADASSPSSAASMLASDTPSLTASGAAATLANYNSGGVGGLATQAWSSSGDAAFSDGLGVARLSGRTQQPSNTMNRAQRAQVGDIPGTSYGLRAYS